MRKQITRNLFARQLVFGWTVSAPSKDSGNTQAFRASVDSVDFELQQFCEIEELPQRLMWTKEESDCNEHFCENTKIESNRYCCEASFQDLNEARRKFGSSQEKFEYLENRLTWMQNQT